MSLRGRSLTCASLAIAATVVALPADQQPTEPGPEARQRLIDELNRVGAEYLDARKRAIEGVNGRVDARRRQNTLRDRLLAAIGGLPVQDGNVAVQTFGSVEGDGFRVEKIAYESLPGFWVTANVYVPSTGSGRRPAVVIAPGHGAGGKSELWSFGGNFARNGIIALAYDPIGQGERLQYLDSSGRASYVGGSTGEHGMANIAPLLIGETLARYMVNDAMRGIDYLADRKDVDDGRIGAFGCSGGGTTTAYLAALDDRVKAAASACYITSFSELLRSATGNQEAEQSLPGFLSQGLDFADWIEAAAPRAYAIVSTQEDMFPIAGAQQTYEEAKRFYALYGAEDRLQWITAPGGHGNLGPVSQDILTFFTKHLNAGGAKAAFTPLRLDSSERLTVTPTGQVASSLEGRALPSIVRERGQTLMSKPAQVRDRRGIEQLRDRVRKDVRELTGAVATGGGTGPTAVILPMGQRLSYRMDLVAIGSSGETPLMGLLATPEGAGQHPATILMTGEPRDAMASAGSELDRLARDGSIVLALEPRPTPPGTESIKSPYLGGFNLLSLRALLVGRTLIGLRIDDTLRAVDWLSAQNRVSGNVAIVGEGAHALTALHAAVLDERIASTLVRRSLLSYRKVLDQPGHRNMPEVVIPGVLRRYDVGDLVLATWPRRVHVLGPIDAAGVPAGETELREWMTPLFETEAALEKFVSDAPRLKVSMERPQGPQK